MTTVTRYKGIAIDNPDHYYIVNAKHMEQWLCQKFKCVYCHKKDATLKDSLGKMECSFHPGSPIHCNERNIEICRRCKENYGKTLGCVRCDHNYVHFTMKRDPKTGDIVDSIITIPFLFAKTILDNPKWYGKPDVKMRNRPRISGERRKFVEKEDVDHLESHGNVLRYDVDELFKHK